MLDDVSVIQNSIQGFVQAAVVEKKEARAKFSVQNFIKKPRVATAATAATRQNTAPAGPKKVCLFSSHRLFH